MDEWIDGWVDGWMDGWMNGLMDGWMDGWIREMNVENRVDENSMSRLKQKN